MVRKRVLELPPLRLALATDKRPLGTKVLEGLLGMASDAVRHVQESPQYRRTPRVAAVGRLRGTGRGIHFRDFVTALEQAHPIHLATPFEGSQLVAGAAWDAGAIVGSGAEGALAKLRWSAGADDLPMHVHEHSDRFIIVHQGRGYFHVTDESVEEFTGKTVRSIPARERDVFLFTRGVVHTFSTADEPMTLLSCQLPFLPFDDPRQYRLPVHLWTARENPEQFPPTVQCDAAWAMCTGGH